MTITKIENSKSLKIILSGWLDNYTSVQLEETIDESLEGKNSVEIDFADVNYVSSAGLHVLLSAYKRLKKNDGSLSFTNVNPSVLEILEIANFDELVQYKKEVKAK